MDNYNEVHGTPQFKTFYNKTDSMSTGPYATTVILSNMPERDDNLIPTESPHNTLSGGNVQNSCDSSCTDNNAGRDMASNSSSDNPAVSRSSPPILPAFSDILPPPPLYPPPSSSTAHGGFRLPSSHVSQSAVRPIPAAAASMPRFATHCTACHAGLHTTGLHTAGHQPRAHFMLDSQGRPFNPTMPHTHSNFAHGDNDYQVTYPSLPRADGSHHYQTYRHCTLHGHGSDAHDYAEPLMEQQNMYGGVPPLAAPMPPIAHQIIPPPHLLHYHQHPQHCTHRQSKLKPQSSVPAHLKHGQRAGPKAEPQNVQRHQSLPSSDHSQDLCHSCAEFTEYEEPWTDQNWPLLWNQASELNQDGKCSAASSH